MNEQKADGDSYAEGASYIATVGDLAIVPWSRTVIPRIYSVVAVRLGGLGEDGHVEVSSVGMKSENMRIPYMLWERAVFRGAVQIVWREGRCY
jgi:hypothetical protein